VNCRKVNHLLSAYMDGELPGVEHRQIHEHLARCPECAEEYTGLLRMKRLLAGLRVREPRTEIGSRIVAHVHRSQDSHLAGTSSRWTQQINLWWRGAAPHQPTLALGVGLAVIGMIAVSQMVDGREMLHSYREPIHWSPVNASTIANQEPAPDYALVSSRSNNTQPGMSLSNVGYSTSGLNLSRDDLSGSNPDPDRGGPELNVSADRHAPTLQIDASMLR
jgi:anti-sigma factor RsiW